MHVIEMVAQVRASTHEVDTNFLNDGDIVRFLNRGQYNLQRILSKKYEEFFHEEHTDDLVSGTADYDMPSDILANRIQKIEIESGSYKYPVERISLSETSNDECQGSSSIPDYFCILGNTIRFYPEPSSSISDGIKIFYTKRYPELGQSLGVITGTTSSILTVDSISTDSDSGSVLVEDNDYINVSNRYTGAINGTYLVDSVDSVNNRLTISTGISVTLSAAVADGDYFTFDSGDDLSTIRCSDSLVITGTTNNNGTYTIANVDNTNKYIYIIGALTDESGGTAAITMGTFENLSIATSITGVSIGDIVTKAPKIGYSLFPRGFHDYLVQFGIVEVLKKAKEPIDEEKRALEELEKEISNTWQDRLTIDKIRVTQDPY